MSSPQFLRIENQQKAVDKLNRLSGGVDNTEPVLKRSGDAYFAHVARVFDTEGRVGGAQWQPLSKKRVRARGGSGHPILAWTGDLRRAASRNQAFNGEDIASGQFYAPKRAEFYISGDKVRHMTGFKSPEYGDVPARPFWPWSDTEHDLVFAPFEKWANDWLRSA